MGTRVHGSEIIIFGTAAGMQCLGLYLQAVDVFCFFLPSFFLSYRLLRLQIFDSGYPEYKKVKF